MVDEHPYALARTAGDLVFISGALGIDASGQPVEGRRQALDAALDRLTERLETVGLSLSDIIDTTYFVTDITLRDEANQQFIDVFSFHPPTRTFVEVSQLPYGARVEIRAVGLGLERANEA